MLKKYLSWEEHVKQVIKDNPKLNFRQLSETNHSIITQLLSQKLQNLPIRGC